MNNWLEVLKPITGGARLAGRPMVAPSRGLALLTKFRHDFISLT